MCLLACMCIVLSFLGGVSSSCPSQCTCDYHGRNDGSGSRSVLCNDLDLNEVPTNIPVDTAKLRIEKTVIRSIPAEAFYYLGELRHLWLAYNSVASVEPRSFYNLKELHELRLDGNCLATFPWASLSDMPHLKTLDLHNNRITSVPNEASRYLKNLAYLDLSSNRLTTLPPDFMESWSHLARTPPRSPDFSPGRIILGLQDNPWFCDCHISTVIELSKVADPAVVLLDPLMVCSEPERLTGIPFQRAELEQCLKPLVMASATKITSTLGSNVLLRCDATGYPTPQLVWTRSDSLPANYRVIQESPGDGVRWSIISLTGISYKDAGDYKCKAKNLAGTSEAVVTVTVVGAVTTTLSPDTSESRMGGRPEPEVQPGSGRSASTPASPSSPWSSFSFSSSPSSSTSLSASTLSPPSTSSFSSSPFFSILSLSTLRSSISSGEAGRQPLQLHPERGRDVKVERSGGKRPPASASKKEELALLGHATPVEMNATIADLRVVSETEESVTLTWNSVNATPHSAVTVLYSKYGEKDLLLSNADSSNNQVTIDGLEPGRQYVACVCPRGVPPQKGQCVTFATDRAGEDGPQWIFLVVVTSAACVVAVPVICFLLYKVCKLQCKPESFWEDDLANETYIQFETPSPRSPSVGELWTRRCRDDSERLLLGSRSSVESQATFKSEGQEMQQLDSICKDDEIDSLLKLPWSSYWKLGQVGSAQSCGHTLFLHIAGAVAARGLVNSTPSLSLLTSRAERSCVQLRKDESNRGIQTDSSGFTQLPPHKDSSTTGGPQPRHWTLSSLPVQFGSDRIILRMLLTPVLPSRLTHPFLGSPTWTLIGMEIPPVFWATNTQQGPGTRETCIHGTSARTAKHIVRTMAGLRVGSLDSAVGDGQARKPEDRVRAFVRKVTSGSPRKAGGARIEPGKCGL
ncbi:leucine-rich repeat, immunoglobulin-like domain and transmembrane domain-containing protein 3 [Erethizon dorsatum]